MKPISDDAKRVLKNCMGGNGNIKYIHICRDFLVSTDSRNIAVIARKQGDALLEGDFTKDFDKVDVPETYIFPDWKKVFPFNVERDADCVFMDREAIVNYLHANNRPFTIDTYSLLLRGMECHVFLYEESTVLYYPTERLFLFVSHRDIDSEIGVKSKEGTLEQICNVLLDKEQLEMDYD